MRGRDIKTVYCCEVEISISYKKCSFFNDQTELGIALFKQHKHQSAQQAFNEAKKDPAARTSTTVGNAGETVAG
jgi:hypothetical protein